MAGLGDLLGTILVSLARARYVADIETAAIAEQYRGNPLLEGLAVPRVRVPEMVIDLPVLIEAEEPGEPNELANADAIGRVARDEFLASAKRAGVGLPDATVARLADSLRVGLAQSRQPSASIPVPKEALLRAVEIAAANTLKSTEGIRPDALKGIVDDVRRRVSEMVEIKPGRAPVLRATLVTSEVKEKAAPQSVVRLRLTLREEGLEWTVTPKSDGTATRTLSPE